MVTTEEFTRLIRAVDAVYKAAHWTPDRPVDEAKLWTELRDAAMIAPGNSPKLIARTPFVLMENDFPLGVYSSEEKASDAKLAREDYWGRKMFTSNYRTPYIRYYKYTLDAAPD